MGFMKGILAGATMGMVIGAMKSEELIGMYRKGKRYVKKVKHSCC